MNARSLACSNSFLAQKTEVQEIPQDVASIPKFVQMSDSASFLACYNEVRL